MPNAIPDKAWIITGDLPGLDVRTKAALFVLMIELNRLDTLRRMAGLTLQSEYESEWGPGIRGGDQVAAFVLLASTLKECIDGMNRFRPLADALIARSQDEGLREILAGIDAMCDTSDPKGLYKLVLERCRNKLGFHIDRGPIQEAIEKSPLSPDAELLRAHRGKHGVLYRFTVADGLTAYRLAGEVDQLHMLSVINEIRDATDRLSCAAHSVVAAYLNEQGCKVVHGPWPAET